MSLPILDLLSSAPADEGPRPGSDRAMIAVARVLDVANGGTTVTVSLLGSAGITLPATASTWTGVETAYVLLDPDTGRPIHVLGPAPAPKTGPMSLSPPEATTNTVTCTAHPTWTGTHAPTGWNRFGAAAFWWIHAMVAVWAVFTLMLFVLEPLGIPVSAVAAAWAIAC